MPAEKKQSRSLREAAGRARPGYCPICAQTKGRKFPEEKEIRDALEEGSVSFNRVVTWILDPKPHGRGYRGSRYGVERHLRQHMRLS